jgi:membrane protein DedA with SNARE-associated domain
VQQLEIYIREIAEFLRMHQEWAPAIVFLVAFGECVAILSWLVPATLFFTVFGGMAGAAGLSLVPLALAASFGAGLGFWVSYWVGLRIGPNVGQYWPLRTRPEMLAKGHEFFEKWGVVGIFMGHFLGPVRGVIALVAGIVKMPALQFQIANWTASFAWGFLLLYGTGMIGQQAVK